MSAPRGPEDSDVTGSGAGAPAGASPGGTEHGGFSLLGPAERRRLARRKRIGVWFRWITFVPMVLAIVLIATLFFDVATDSVSWHVVEPANSGTTWAWSEGFRPFGTWERVVRLELAAQGESAEAVDALLDDAEQRRRFSRRNRVELMWWTDDGPLRWVVSNSRDDAVRGPDNAVLDVPFLQGFGERQRLLELLEPDQNLYLNPWLDVSFFSMVASRTPTMAGIRTALFGSLWVIGLVILISLPLGVGAALYLEEYAPDNWLTRLIEVNIRNLAGVPSIVYGILGLYVIVRLMQIGPTILAAAMTLSLLILPVVIIAAREAIRGVPPSLRQASYGLGATKWQTVARVVLPNSIGGITTGVILAVARAIGETAPLLLVGAAAFIAFNPSGPLSRYTVMPIQIYSWVAENDVEFVHVASAAILVLLALLIALYALANWVRRRYERTW